MYKVTILPLSESNGRKTWSIYIHRPDEDENVHIMFNDFAKQVDSYHNEEHAIIIRAHWDLFLNSPVPPKVMPFTVEEAEEMVAAMHEMLDKKATIEDN